MHNGDQLALVVLLLLEHIDDDLYDLAKHLKALLISHIPWRAERLKEFRKLLSDCWLLNMLLNEV